MKYLMMIFSFVAYGATFQSGIYKGYDDLGRACQVELKLCSDDSVRCVSIYGLEYDLAYSFLGYEGLAIDSKRAKLNDKNVDFSFNFELDAEGSLDSYRSIVTERGYMVPYPKSYFLNCYRLSL